MTSRSLVAVLTASTFLVSGVAFAAEQGRSGASDQARMPPALAKAEHDLGKVSLQGSRAYQDIALARLAIFEGQTEQAKKLATEADGALTKAKTDETAFEMADAAVTGAPNAKGTQAASAASNGNETSPNDGAHGATHLWLPVYTTIQLGEAYKVSPGQQKAVADANEHLRKGDREGALERLKLAGVDMDVTQALLPLKQTIGDVHQASSMIDSGKFYEGSQMLRKVEASVRFDVASYKQGAEGHRSYSFYSDLSKPTANASTREVAAANGAEPPSAPDPQYAPMRGEPEWHPTKSVAPTLTDGMQAGGSTTAAEPPSAPDPSR